MTEVLKNKSTESTDWESLMEADAGEASTTTWDDLTELAEKGNSAVELSPKELAKLSKNENDLYENSPETFAKLWELKQDKPKSELGSLTAQLAQYYNPENLAIKDRVVPDSRTLDNLADIYSLLHNEGNSLPVSRLLKKGADEIEEIRHMLDQVNDELFPQENEPKPRSTIITSILRKIHRGATKEKGEGETTSQLLAAMHKRQFLVRLAKNYSPENTKVDSTLDLAKLYTRAIDEDDKALSNFINGNLSSKQSTDDLLTATKVFEEIKSDPDKNMLEAQKRAISQFYEMGGLHTLGKDYLTENILPLYEKKEFSYGNNALLTTVLAQDGTPENFAKMDYTLKNLVPKVERENENGNDTSFMSAVLAKMAASATNVEELAGASEVAFTELIPFTTEQKGATQSSYAWRLTLNNLVQRSVQLVGEDGEVDAKARISELIKACNTQIMPILDNPGALSEKASGLEWQLADEAYAKNYEERFTDFLRDDIFPRIRRGDIELGGLLRETNLSGEERIAAFEFNCIGRKINPRGINDILMQRYELPTGNARILEQNRVDSLALEHVVYSDHSFIHAEYSKRNDVIQAMIEYYDSAKSGNTDAIADARRELQYVADELEQEGEGGRYWHLGAEAFDLSSYDRMIEGEVDDDMTIWRTYNIKAIDVLRRLEENTRPQKIEKPELDDAEWQELVEKVDAGADWRNVGKLIEYTNRWLIGKQNQYGLTPAKVEAIAYAERMATLVMREVTEKERAELPYDETFKEFVRFQELIGGYDSYNDERFEEFYSNFSRVPMGLDKRELRENFSKLQERVLMRSRGLVKHYKAIGKPKREYMLQSNNLFNELIRLTEPRAAKTLRERADYMAEGLEVSHKSEEDSSDETK